MNKIELLAPARDTQSAIRAIQCGADAVYIGAPKFSARKAVGNSIEDIATVVEFAHKYFARVYVALNTILTDDELEEAHKLVWQLYETSIDALIIQDMGLLEFDLPPIALIASTQVHNSTPDKIKFLENIGFKRAILARELTLDEIKDIRSKTGIELECFVHGSLCVSYSGQCYLSYSIGNRSGNRGDCAQPCRKKYTMTDSGSEVILPQKYLLSLKDLNLSDYLRELIEARVTSFKIEGRLRDINYVTNIVSYYRGKIDEILGTTAMKKSSSGNVFINFEPDAKKTFNRGYTTYFIHGRDSDIASPNTPKSMGEKVGTVRETGKNWFTLDSDVKMNNGDGICFFDAESELDGTLVNRVDGEKIYPANMESILTGTAIYRNLGHEFLKKLKNAKIERKIDIELDISEYEDGITVTATDSEGITAQKQYPCAKEISNDPQSMKETIIRQFSKLGDTEFALSRITIDLLQIYFFQIRVLNEIRRDIIETLHKNRKEFFNRNREFIKIEKTAFPYIVEKLGFDGNVFNEKAREFYKRHGVEEIEPAAESGMDMAGKKVMTTKHCLKCQAGLCPKYNHSNSGKFFKEPFYLVDEHGKKFRLVFDCPNCRMEIVCEPHSECDH